jgi:hypothetical protein
MTALRAALAPFRAVLATPGATRFALPGFVGRMPIAMLGLGTVLMLVATSGSFALAGGVSATLAAAQAAAAPALGRLADRVGARAVLVPQLTVHAAGLLALVAVAEAPGPTWALFASAAVAGAAVPQLGAFVRARWTGLLGAGPRLETAYAFEGAADEVIFIVGPLLVTLLATGVAPAAGLMAALAFTLAGGAAFALAAGHPASADPRAPRAASAFRVPGLRVLAGVFAALGAIFGAVDVALVAFAREEGAPAAAGALIALFAVGSLVAGVLYGALRHRGELLSGRGDPVARFRVAVAALALGTVPVALSPTLPVMAAAITLAGLAIAPSLIAGNSLVPRLVPDGALNEGFTWLSIALMLGVAAGAPAAGWAVDAAGARAALLVAVLAGAVAAAGAWCGTRALRRGAR